MTSIAFFGTPKAAVPTLEAVADQVELVVTRPDKAKGRSSRPEPSPVKSAATRLGIPVFHPRRDEIARVIAGVEAAVVVAYGRIIPEEALEAVPFGFLNVHFSLLPRWRGAAPVERALLAGDEETGVTIMRLDAGLDTGPTLASTRRAVDADTDAEQLTAELAETGARLLHEILDDYLLGRLEPVPQSEEGVTYAPRMEREDSRLVFTEGAVQLDRIVRASTSRGGAYTYVDGLLLKVWKARPTGRTLEPGQILRDGRRVLVGAGTGALELLEVQPAGKRRMAADAWARGHKTVTVT